MWMQGRMSLVRHKYLLCLWQDLSQGTTAVWKEKWADFDDFAGVMTLAVHGPITALLEGITRGRVFFPPSKQKQLHFNLRTFSFPKALEKFPSQNLIKKPWCNGTREKIL